MNRGAPHGPGRAPRRVTLLTDFGTADGYVAAMKGVIVAIAPETIIDDASHDIPPGDVHAASWALGAYWNLYPSGTIHVVVVDPGVGSARRAIAVDVDDRVIVAPDNGVISAVLLHGNARSAVELRNPEFMRSSVSATFHGRDVFAPAAAHVATGVPLHELGPPITDPVLLAATELARAGDSVIGCVVHVDRFGNLITDLPASGVRGGTIEVQGGVRVAVRRTYSDAAPGELLALAGSRGMIEVAVRDGNAAGMLGAGRGSPVVWHPSDASDAAPDIRNDRDNHD